MILNHRMFIVHNKQMPLKLSTLLFQVLAHSMNLV